MCEMNHNSHINHLRSQLDFRSHACSLAKVIDFNKLIYYQNKRESNICPLSDY